MIERWGGHAVLASLLAFMPDLSRLRNEARCSGRVFHVTVLPDPSPGNGEFSTRCEKKARREAGRCT